MKIFRIYMDVDKFRSLSIHHCDGASHGRGCVTVSISFHSLANHHCVLPRWLTIIIELFHRELRH